MCSSFQFDDHANAQAATLVLVDEDLPWEEHEVWPHARDYDEDTTMDAQ